MTGSMCVIQEEKIFEWTIKNFLQIEDNVYSPEFCFAGEIWRISICPHGGKKNQLCGYSGLHVDPITLPKPLAVNMTLSFKTIDGKSELEDTFTGFFNKNYIGFARPYIILKSDLIKRRSKLLPSGAITVICSLKNSEPSVVNEHKLLDASVQTSEITGIWELQKHLHDISTSGDISDVILKVGDQEFKSHRCILAARSSVFADMMKNDMKENVIGVVDFQDVNPQIFSNFFNYLYTGNTENITLENVTKLFTVADKYQVEILKENCLNYMLVNVCVENFCDVFMLSIQYNEEKLKETCFQFFGKHYLDIIQTCKWLSFCCEKPIICNELHIKHAKLNNKDTSA